MAELTVIIPMLPDRSLSPNSRVHWRKKATAARELRYAASMATYGYVYPVDVYRGAIMDVEIQWCCGRKAMDDDNAWASLKAARDGIADVLFNGEDRFITQGKLLQTRGDGSIRITLRGLTDGG